MKKHLATILAILCALTVARASQMGDTAAPLADKEWAKVDDWASLSQAIAAAGWSDESCEWSDSAAWDPVAKRLVWVMSDVGTSPHEEFTYDEVANTWRYRNFDSAAGASTTTGHAYDGNTADPAGGRVFFARHDEDVWEGTWNAGQAQYDWSRIPSPPNMQNSEGCGQAFVPWLNNGSGGLLRDTPGGTVYWWDGNSWTGVSKPYDAYIHTVMEVNPAEEYVMLAGGGTPSSPRNTCFVWDRGAAAFERCASLPVATVVTYQNLVYDPGSQKLILWGGSKDNRYWSYDRATDTWSEITGFINKPSWFGSWDVDPSTCVATVGIPEHGVVAFVKMDARASCEREPGRCGIWLVRFGSSEPECSDGRDNDGDGAIDFGADGGCTSATDTDESNCGDGVCENQETSATCPADCPIGNADIADPGDVAWDPSTPYSLGYKIPLLPAGTTDSDANRNSSVAVRYRTVGGAWREAYSPLLVLEETIRDAPHREGRNFSGAIWDLQPDTTYEVEFTITDPDGLNEVRTETTSTRPEPVAQPVSPNYPCPDGNTTDVTDDGPADECTSLAEINQAIAAAVPGSVIKVAAGTYGPGPVGDGGLITFQQKNGTQPNPIVLRCVDRDNTVIDGGQLDWAIDVENSSYITIEDCTLTGGWQEPGDGSGNGPGAVIAGHLDITGLVIRRNKIFTLDNSAIWLKNYNKKQIDILDNFLDGPRSFPERHTSSSEGIIIHGQGHVIAHNTIRGHGDSIGTSKSEIGAIGPHRHMNIFGNDIQFSEDDCIETDYSHANLLIHHNKCQNYNSCLSAQPTFGGPFYFMRNVCWSSGNTAVKTLKIQRAADNWGDPSGVHVFNNLLTMPIVRYSRGTWEYHELNNLFVGLADGTFQIHSNTSVNLCGSFEDGSGSPPDARNCNNHGTLDYAALSYDGAIDLPPCGSSSTLAGFKSSTTCYQNSFLATDPIFRDIPSSDYPDIEDSFDAETRFHAVGDVSLATGSNVVDRGTIIPNVTDGFAGAAPDIGPLEAGETSYPYGIRGWTYDVARCADGRDNDGDGLTDAADPGCTDPNDPSERGTTTQCDNGLDDDGDGAYDYPEDPDCASALDPDESTLQPQDDTPPTVPTNVRSTDVQALTVALAWDASSDPDSGVSSYRIYRDGALVGESPVTSYTDGGLTEATTYRYEVTAVNGAGLQSGKSSPPLDVTTVADTDPPGIASVTADGDPDRVVVVYDEPVESASASDPANYRIDNGVSVLAAALAADAVTVTLTTSDHTEGVQYALTVSGVRDRARSPNTIPPGTQATYQYAAALVISNVVAESGKPYAVEAGFANGSVTFIDRTYVFSEVPGELVGSDYIKTANDDKQSTSPTFLSFDINRGATVWVAHDDRHSSRPAWLASFEDSGLDLKVDWVTHSLFRKVYPAGTVVLGGNNTVGSADNNNMYAVIVSTGSSGPVGDPPPAPTGLRPKTSP